MPSTREQTSQREVIDAAQAIFDAMRVKDRARLEAGLWEGAVIVRVARTASGSTDVERVDRDAFIESVLSSPRELDEVFVEAPQVRTSTHLADLRARYELRVDGERHHCGTDLMHFARVDDRWLVTAITYDEDPGACPDA